MSTEDAWPEIDRDRLLQTIRDAAARGDREAAKWLRDNEKQSEKKGESNEREAKRTRPRPDARHGRRGAPDT